MECSFEAIETEGRLHKLYYAAKLKVNFEEILNFTVLLKKYANYFQIYN
jgi:hypothetical protein